MILVAKQLHLDLRLFLAKLRKTVICDLICSVTYSSVACAGPNL